MKFTIYSQETGRVLFSGTADNPEYLVQQGQGVYLGDVFTGGYMQEGQHYVLSPQPDENHIFNWLTKQWEDPRTPDTEWPLVRAHRNCLLTESDWTQLPDVPLATKEAWAAYRQALRDITEQPDPFSIVWPTPPA